MELQVRHLAPSLSLEARTGQTARKFDRPIMAGLVFLVHWGQSKYAKKDSAMTTITDRIEIQVDSRRVLDERLNDAVRDLQEQAMLTGTHGILITRHEPGHYSAALSDQVPFGMTREVQQ